MMTMVALRRSSALADASSAGRAQARAAAERTRTRVQVGGVGSMLTMGPRTAVGSSYKAMGGIFARAGADIFPVDKSTQTYDVPPTSTTNPPALPPPVTNDPANPNYKPPTTTMTKPGPMQVSTLGKVATIALVTPFVLGPPVIGYLLFGWLGAAAGALIAAPVALGVVAFAVVA